MSSFAKEDADSSDEETIVASSADHKGLRKPKKKKANANAEVDLRHILGFLNQTEWIQNLNIGNIMQISPL